MLARSCTLRWILLLGCLAILAACGGDDDDDSDETPTDAGVVITSTPTNEPTRAVEPTATSASEQTATASDAIQPRPSGTPAINNTLTPAAGAPPTEGDVLVSTDFSDWITQEFDSGTISFVDGTYRLAATQGGGTFVSAYTEDTTFTDFSVSVDLRMLSDSENATGCVLARMQPVDLNYDYALCLDGTGGISMLYEEFDAEGAYTSELLITEPLRLEGSAREWNRLKIIARGGDFWFYVNDELVGSASHDGPTEGHAGIIVNNFGETPAEFEFTNLIVRALE